MLHKDISQHIEAFINDFISPTQTTFIPRNVANKVLAQKLVKIIILKTPLKLDAPSK